MRWGVYCPQRIAVGVSFSQDEQHGAGFHVILINHVNPVKLTSCVALAKFFVTTGGKLCI